MNVATPNNVPNRNINTIVPVDFKSILKNNLTIKIDTICPIKKYKQNLTRKIGIKE